MNLIYPLLNSSFLYWWWRVNDGGMTLSSATLKSLPLPPDLKAHPEIVEELEQSERINLVVKMNAGKEQENVRHTQKLVNRINVTLFGEENAAQLLKTHSNSNV
jgi:hypothetical protein